MSKSSTPVTRREILIGGAVPISDSAELSSKIVKNATLKVIPGAPHGLCTTHADQINASLLDFLKA